TGSPGIRRRHPLPRPRLPLLPLLRPPFLLLHPPPLPRPRRPRRRVRRNRRTDRRPAAPAEGSSRLPSRAGGLRRVQDPAGQGNTDGGDSRSSSSMPGAERTTSPARCTGCCSPVSRAVTWYSSTVRGPLSVACASLFTRAQDWSTVRGARTGSVKATRRTRVADVEGVRRRSRAVATRKAGEEPVKAWARTLPSVAWLPVGSVRTQ